MSPIRYSWPTVCVFPSCWLAMIGLGSIRYIVWTNTLVLLVPIAMIRPRHKHPDLDDISPVRTKVCWMGPTLPAWSNIFSNSVATVQPRCGTLWPNYASRRQRHQRITPKLLRRRHHRTLFVHDTVHGNVSTPMFGTRYDPSIRSYCHWWYPTKPQHNWKHHKAPSISPKSRTSCFVIWSTLVTSYKLRIDTWYPIRRCGPWHKWRSVPSPKRIKLDDVRITRLVSLDCVVPIVMVRRASPGTVDTFRRPCGVWPRPSHKWRTIYSTNAPIVHSPTKICGPLSFKIPSHTICRDAIP